MGESYLEHVAMIECDALAHRHHPIVVIELAIYGIKAWNTVFETYLGMEWGNVALHVPCDLQCAIY